VLHSVQLKLPNWGSGSCSLVTLNQVWQFGHSNRSVVQVAVIHGICAALSQLSTLFRLPRPLHRELDIVRLDLAPALDLGLEPVLRVPLEIFFANCRRRTGRE
jgi:hypothetical protein